MNALRSLARALGGEVSGDQVLAPGPGHRPRDRSLLVKLGGSLPDGFMVHSYAGDDWRECRDHVNRARGLAIGSWRRTEKSAQVDQNARREIENDPRRRGVVASIVSGMVRLRGTPGEAYLRDARRIDVGEISDVLDRTDAIGWHRECLFLEDGRRLHGKRIGAIIGVQTDPATGKLAGGISRTYVHEGRKVGKAKSLGPAGIVRLSRDEDVLGGLFIAEGLETALAGMSIGLRPMCSMGSTAIMANMPVLAGIESISVLADNDANGAGERAARELQSRWRAAGREARLWKPNTLGDLNDMLIGASDEP
jgi:putative DNA primase/helicase